MNKESILITGSLGSFGRVLTEELMKNYKSVNLLVRAKTDSQPVERVKAVFGDVAIDKIMGFQCDLKEENLGLSRNDYQFLIKETTHILHAAASTRFDLTISEARDSNVKTVENILAFAENCKQLKKLGFEIQDIELKYAKHSLAAQSFVSPPSSSPICPPGKFKQPALSPRVFLAINTSPSRLKITRVPFDFMFLLLF